MQSFSLVNPAFHCLFNKFTTFDCGVAEEPGISERTLYRKLNKYNLADTGKGA